MPVASGKRFAAGPKGTYCPMPSPDETPKIEGTVDKERRKSQDDTVSRRAMKESGRVVTKAGPEAPTVTKPSVYGGKRR